MKTKYRQRFWLPRLHPPLKVPLFMAGALLIIAAAGYGALTPLRLSNPAQAAVAPLAAGQTTVSYTTITIPTHPVDQALSYLVNPTYNIPYARLDRSQYDGGKLVNRTFNLIVLENDYLKLSVMPELGGRIYQAFFKPTGHNIFYQNPVLKPSPWGPPEMGWWLAAGGMEWGLPVEEHGYEWGIPWSYKVTDLADGAMVEVWDSTAPDRLRAKVAITLPDDAAYFQVAPTLENPTNQPIDYKFWLNAMLAPGSANQVSPYLRIIMPTNEVTVHSTGDRRLPGAWSAAGWPVHNSVDWSLLGNWREWYGFFQRPRAAGDFQAIYDEAYDEGVVRTYDSRIVQGAKFFAFGSGTKAISPDLYTDGNSSYVEMHGGVAPTFADTRRLEAHASLSWQERWYPVAGLGSLTWANDRLALRLEDSADQTRLRLAVTRATPEARILLLRRTSNEVLYDARATLQPGQPFASPWLTLPNLNPADMAVVVYDSSGAVLGAYQYQGGPVATPTPGPSPTSTPGSAWQGRLLRTIPIQGWSSIVRIWVRNKIGLPVTIAIENGSWRTVGYVGSKPEYGVDALEFAPLAAGVYRITPQGLNTSFRVNVPASSIVEVLFEETQMLTPTPSPTITSSSTPGSAATPTPTSSPTSAASPTPSATPTASPTATATPTRTATPTLAPVSAWAGRIRRTVRIAGWSSIARIWVSGQRQTPVTLAAVNWNWRATSLTGSKPEYGPDALEFAPLAPGRYSLTVPSLSARFDFDLPASTLAEIVLEPVLSPTATPTLTPTPTPSFTPTPTPTHTPTATPLPPTLTSTPTSSSTPEPTQTPTLTPTPTSSSTPPEPTTTSSPAPSEPTPPATESPTVTATSTPTLTPTPTPTPSWRVRIPTNITVPGNWFAVIRVSVEGLVRQPVRLTIVTNDPNPYQTTCLTGTKPEYGPYFCEFAPLIPGQYRLAPDGLDISTTVEVGRGGVAVVIFERN